MPGAVAARDVNGWVKGFDWCCLCIGSGNMNCLTLLAHDGSLV